MLLLVQLQQLLLFDYYCCLSPVVCVLSDLLRCVAVAVDEVVVILTAVVRYQIVETLFVYL